MLAYMASLLGMIRGLARAPNKGLVAGIRAVIG